MQHPTEQQMRGSVIDQLKAELEQVGPTAFTAANYQPGTLRHVVLFRYRDAVTVAQRAEIKKRFLALRHTATREGRPYIASLESGAQSSGEGVEHGFEQGFIVTFNSIGDRNYYVGTPVVCQPEFYDQAHAAFKEFVGPFLIEGPAGVLVFDFVVEQA